MATTYQDLPIGAAVYRSTVFPALVKANGTAIPVLALAYDAAGDEASFWYLKIQNYGTGNVTVTLSWYADTATTGNVVFGASLAAITADVDTGDVEAKALSTEATATVACRSSAQSATTASVVVTSLDSLSNGDDVFIRVRRVGSNGSDTMAGDAVVFGVQLSYSDT